MYLDLLLIATTLSKARLLLQLGQLDPAADAVSGLFEYIELRRAFVKGEAPSVH